MKVGFITLTKEPSDSHLFFTQQLNDIKFPSYIVIDNNSYFNDDSLTSFNLYTNKSLDIKDKLLFVDDNECKKAGYTNLNFIIKKSVSAWDKVLYLLNNSLKEYDFVWIVEDDVFIPSINSVLDMTEKYSQYDLVIQKDISKFTDTRWDHWNHVPKKWKPKIENNYYHSMACVTGISRRFLNIIDLYAKTYKSLFFLEIMFITLAHEHNLRIINPPELKTIVWRVSKFQSDWSYENILEIITKEKMNLWFHPIKDYHSQMMFRYILQDYFSNNYIPEITDIYPTISNNLKIKNKFNIKVKKCINNKVDIISYLLNDPENIIIENDGISCYTRTEVINKYKLSFTNRKKLENTKYSFYKFTLNNTGEYDLKNYTINDFLTVKSSI